MKFVDQIRIHAKAGDGGSGCCSFRREKYIPKGGPDGGNGGKGGDIILQADTDTASLVAMYYQPELRAKDGARGQGSDKIGRASQPMVVRVPVGTLVYELPTPPAPGEMPVEVDDASDAQNEGEESAQKKKRRLDPRTLEPIFDLSMPGQEVILCQGGEGGRGNASFKTSTNRAPRQFTEGKPGEEGWFVLELQSIALAGLVGFPNAGKSTLLNKLSAARPKIAAYPFTTLHPHIGVVELPEYRSATVADIPGLIDGAHEDRGLGHEFLRHILRCRHLLIVLDLAGSEGRDPLLDLENLRQELSLYDPVLGAKEWTVIGNKMDLPGSEDNLVRLRSRFSSKEIIPVAAASGQGIDQIKDLLDRIAPPC